MSGRSVILSTLFLGKPLRGMLPVLSAHPFAINWQMLFPNQHKRKNGRRNIFMTKSEHDCGTTIVYFLYMCEECSLKHESVMLLPYVLSLEYELIFFLHLTLQRVFVPKY